MFDMAYECENCGATTDKDVSGLSGVHELNSEADCCSNPDYVES